MDPFGEQTLREEIIKQWGEDSQHLDVFDQMLEEVEQHGCTRKVAAPLMEKPKREYCNGCENEYYHQNTTRGCWSFDKAKLMLRKKVHVDQVPPWNQEAEPYLSCYHVKRYVFVKPDQTC